MPIIAGLPWGIWALPFLPQLPFPAKITTEVLPLIVVEGDPDRPEDVKAGFDRVRVVAGVAREVLDELGIVGYPKTSGGNGLHVYVRIVPEWEFADVRRAALAFAREVERRLPGDATTTWWRKDRDPRHVFIDYNQNARDHTIAAAYSVRGVPDGTVSTPIRWDEITDVDPRSLTLATVPARYAALGDLHARIDDTAYRLDTLLEWADRDERDGAATPPEPETDANR